MKEYKRVYVTKDDDGHDYIIPWELKDDFNTELENGYDDEFESFNEKFGDYMTGGDINETGLFIKINH